IYEDLKDDEDLANTHGHLLATYRDAGEYKNALSQAFAAKQFAERWERKQPVTMKNTFMVANVLSEIGIIYQYLNVLDSAEYYTRKSISKNPLVKGANWNFPVYLLGTIKMKEEKYEEALENYRLAIRLAVENG